MSLTADEFLVDVAAVFIRGQIKNAFGSGRLIAPGLVLTAGHVVDYPTRDTAVRVGWKVCLIGERTKGGTWENSPHDAKVLWRGSGDVDLAILGLTGKTNLVPTLAPVFASYDLLGPITEVTAAGFPEAWEDNSGTLNEFIAHGSLRIVTQYKPYAWTVPEEDTPDQPQGWKGMSGASLSYVGADNKIYVFGVIQQVPAYFTHGILQVARISDGFTDTTFCNHLKIALGSEPRMENWRDIRFSDKLKSLSAERLSAITTAAERDSIKDAHTIAHSSTAHSSNKVKLETQPRLLSMSEIAHLRSLGLVRHYNIYRSYYIEDARMMKNVLQNILQQAKRNNAPHQEADITPQDLSEIITPQDLSEILRQRLITSDEWNRQLTSKRHLPLGQYDLVTDAMARYIVADSWRDITI